MLNTIIWSIPESISNLGTIIKALNFMLILYRVGEIILAHMPDVYKVA